ncbi:hypothetical protein NC651_035144 [Populus alba x Populus x berolinensis]|nr:hypothetical protein NC651_035144 [Populus alba x Populus x berolinensis]
MRWGPHREKETEGRYRTGIKLSGLDNAGKSVPFLHGLERFPASGQLFLGSDPRNLEFLLGLEGKESKKN